VLPLCPKLAEVSYDGVAEGKGKIIGRFVAEQAARRGIEINPLSQFAAEFRGPQHQIEWLRANYPAMLCAFNSKLVVNAESVYKSSMHHVREWMQLVETGHLEQLMDSQYLFCPNCCLGGGGQ
jgi:hypothetical protein